jgi:O-antigen ligase
MLKNSGAVNPLLLLVLLFIPFSFGMGNGVIDTTQVLLAILAIWISYTNKYNDFKDSLKQRWFIFFAVLWLYMIVRSLFAPNITSSLSHSLPWIRYALFTIAVTCALSWNKDYHKKLFIAFAVALFIISCNALVQFFFGRDFFGHDIIKMGAGPTEFLRLTTLNGKLRVGYISAFLVLPLLGYVVHNLIIEKSKNHKLLAFMSLSVVLGFVVILLSGERMPLAIAGISVLLCPIFIKEVRKIGILFIALGILASVVAVYSSDKLYNRIVGITSHQLSNVSGDSYGKIYNGSIELWKSNKVFGIGMNGFRTECENLKEYRCANHIHNIYIQMLSEGGVIAINLFLCFVLALLYRFYKGWSYIPIWAKFTAMLVCAKLMPFMPSGDFTASDSSTPMWFAIGIVLSQLKKA